MGLRHPARGLRRGAGIWWTGLFPGLAIVLLVTGLTLLGEGLNETINPVLRKRQLAGRAPGRSWRRWSER